MAKTKLGAEVDDREWQKQLKRISKLTKGPHVLVGVMASAGDAEGGEFSLAELAAVHEFGSPENGIPERSFIRSTITAVSEERAKLVEKIMDDILHEKDTIEGGLAKLGLWLVNKIKSRIRNREIIPRLEDSEAGRRTIKRKGSDVTLVDTAQLLNAISWRVESGGD